MGGLFAGGLGNAWLFAPTAVLLGALHGLEPGHSKTMIAAFIVAIRGTVLQAVLLGVAATLSHTLIVWLVALGGMYWFGGASGEAVEPYFQVASGVLIVAVAAWMTWRTWRDAHPAPHAPHHHAHHDHGHRHHDHGHDHGHAHHGHAPHDHVHDDHGPDEGGAHARAHADDIRRRFTGGPVTNGQILLFGLTGGLIPCPAAITVLLLCLQVKQIALGAALVFCFSIGLAVTLVAVGAAAALGAGALRRWPWFDTVARRAPYASTALVAAAGLYVIVVGIAGLMGGGHAA